MNFIAKKEITIPYEREGHFYKKVESDESLFFYPVNVVNPGDCVFTRNKDLTVREHGFGGSDIVFRLEDNNRIIIQGPWHCSPDKLLLETGIDLTDKHLTRGVIYRRRVHIPDYGCQDLVYFDQLPTIGSFNRIETMCKKLVQEMKESLYFYSVSVTGSQDRLIAYENID